MGDRLPSLAQMAASAAFSQVIVARYGRTETVVTAVVTCLWYSVSRPTRAADAVQSP